MESVIERIEQGKFWKFHGGIHPPQQKFLSTDKPIRQLPLPELLRIPVQQHIGEPGDILVTVGDKVLKGQALTVANHPMVVPVHAPTSGTITAIEASVIAHPSGLSELCIFLKPDGEEKWRDREICPDYQQLSKNDLIDKIAQAGISGMGGAGFPSHIKLNTAAQINYLIINAAECEPYITADDLLIREQCAAILDGIKILDNILAPAFILIGIEENKPEAIQALKNATKTIDKIKVCVLPVIYPTGGEKQLIQVLTGKEVPSGTLPSALGIVMHNIGTCFAIADAVINDIPLIKRVVTVTGKSVAKPQNVWALIGTPVEFLLQQCGCQQGNKKHIIMGGPMMGFSLPSFTVPVVKTTNCILAPDEAEIPDNDQEVECIRCGQCADVCPSQLLPQELQWSAKAHDHQALNDLNLFDCIECGACAYVCPSHIPLVHYYRVAKAEIRQQTLLDIKAEKAKQRFEARKIRLEREKLAREEKHRKAAEARKARMNSGTAEANNEKSAVAAALARVKAKKAQEKDTNNDVTASDTSVGSPQEIEKTDKKSQVAAAIARAKAKKLAAQTAPNTESNKSTQSSNVIAEAVNNADNSSKAAEGEITDSTSVINTNVIKDIEKPSELSKKDKIAVAIAKAKAKKRATEAKPLKNEPPEDLLSEKPSNDEPDSQIVTNSTNKTEQQVKEQALSPDDIKKAKIAAAIAKAKAKKRQTTESIINNEIPDDNEQRNESAEKEIQTATQGESLDKNARIAAAVAKAKAKKQQESKN
ncbi:electron transport complex subunit RsxC [Thalassotalea profundi]|uniref:Ion-translocating oxidoreductase complex subunit C n=1 Tax=Thalassotalea profundi TaxID=2036687 RepID=A0ABQ3ICA2_9GAMM|nr:electron transport complex subunit RsxC [Thalassotalea profundi]GHE78770.1 electron transport complex subunit C [Thalassotalea profundi]